MSTLFNRLRDIREVRKPEKAKKFSKRSCESFLARVRSKVKCFSMAWYVDGTKRLCGVANKRMLQAIGSRLAGL